MPCPVRWSMHNCHLLTYGTVSFSLIFMGCIFSAFAIFEQKSDISKVWLAGPTTMCVGLVLCGKVIIDCKSPPIIVETADSQDGMDNEFVEEDEMSIPSEPKSDRRHEAILSSIDREYQKKKAAGLLLPNMHAKEKENAELALKNCHHTPQTDTESIIWSPRDDYQTRENYHARDDYHMEETHFYESQPPSYSLSASEARYALNAQDFANSRGNSAGLRECGTLGSPARDSANRANPMRDSANRGNPARDSVNRGNSAQREIASRGNSGPRESRVNMERTPLVDEEHSPLYQGETFVLHEMQYLV